MAKENGGQMPTEPLQVCPWLLFTNGGVLCSTCKEYILRPTAMTKVSYYGQKHPAMTKVSYYA